MEIMDVFNLLAGACSIVSLIIALKTYNKVVNIENQYNIESNANKIDQDQSGEGNIQTVGDCHVYK